MGWDDIKRARRHLSRERGAVVKDWGGRLPVALVYPSSYWVGMSGLGVHLIYSLLNSYADVVCERVFWEKDNARSGNPPLSLETQRRLSDFAVVAFSLSYEVDYLRVPHILRASGIPLYAAERDHRHPLVIAGGPCVTANPAPLSPFLDAIGIGEAEAILPAVLPLISEGVRGGRVEMLRALSELPGMYVPQCYSGAPVARRWAESLDDFPAATAVITPDTELGDLYLMEVERGCPFGCRFCLVRGCFQPMRYRSPQALVEAAREGLQYRRRVGLVGPVVSSYPGIEDLLAELRSLGAGLSLSSLRIKPLSKRLIEEMVAGGAETITLAPEAASERLLKVINKGITRDDVLRAVEVVAGLGVKRLKLYFMLGLPSETDGDAAEISALALACKSIMERGRGHPRLILSLAPFVPKAGTPFQWMGMAELLDLKRRLALIKGALTPKGVQVKAESVEWSQVQAVFSRGDESLAEVIAAVDEIQLPAWRRAVEGCGLDVERYAHARWDTSDELPWSTVDMGMVGLGDELTKALKAL